MSDEEAAFLRAIILSTTPRVEAAIYSDWLDERSQKWKAKRFRGRRPKTLALRAVIASDYATKVLVATHGGGPEVYLLKSRQESTIWHDAYWAHEIADAIRNLLDLDHSQAAVGALPSGRWGIWILNGWFRAMPVPMLYPQGVL